MIIQGHVQNGVVVLDGSVQLSEGQQVSVFVAEAESRPGHSVLDIAPVDVGSILIPLTSDDDLLGEMLEGR